MSFPPQETCTKVSYKNSVLDDEKNIANNSEKSEQEDTDIDVVDIESASEPDNNINKGISTNTKSNRDNTNSETDREEREEGESEDKKKDDNDEKNMTTNETKLPLTDDDRNKNVDINEELQTKRVLFDGLRKYFSDGICRMYMINNDFINLMGRYEGSINRNGVYLYYEQPLELPVPEPTNYKFVFNLFAFIICSMYDNNNNRIIFKSVFNDYIVSFPRFVLMKRHLQCKDMIQNTRNTRCIYYSPFNKYSLNDCLLIALKRTWPSVKQVQLTTDMFCKYFTHKYVIDSLAPFQSSSSIQQQSATNLPSPSNEEDEVCLLLCEIVRYRNDVALCTVRVDITL